MAEIRRLEKERVQQEARFAEEQATFDAKRAANDEKRAKEKAALGEVTACDFKHAKAQKLQNVARERHTKHTQNHRSTKRFTLDGQKQ